MGSRVGRDVAVKFVREDLSGNPRQEAEERLRREARFMGVLSSQPHVVVIHAAGQDPSYGPFLVMELMAGGSLLTRARSGGPMTPIDVASIVWQAAQGLNAAHERGIVHRDVTPSNLLFDADGGLKVGDWGMAKQGETSSLTGVHVVGTLPYMSPEQLTSGAPVTTYTDVYSLAVLAWELLAGRRPYPQVDAAEQRRAKRAGTRRAWIVCSPKKYLENWPMSCTPRCARPRAIATSRYRSSPWN